MGFLSKIKQKKSIEVNFSRSNTFLLYFCEKKMFGRSTTYSCRKNSDVEFHHFMKKTDTGED